MRKSKAFTLAEVLITLVIIGVIAAMTIPTLMGSTNNQEIKAKVKKVAAELNQALALEHALYGKNVINNWTSVSSGELVRMLSNHLSIIEQFEDGSVMFKTADGISLSTWSPSNESSDGLCVALDGFSNFRSSADCWNAEECKQLNPNAFNFSVRCGKATDYRFCPDNPTTYAYVYDISIEEAYEKSGGSNWMSY